VFILGARPSKRKKGDGESLKDERRRKKTKAKSTVPPGTQVIDLADDALVFSSTSCPVTNSTTAPVVTTLNPPSSSTLPTSSTRQESSALTTLSDSNVHMSRSPTSPGPPSVSPSTVAFPRVPSESSSPISPLSDSNNSPFSHLRDNALPYGAIAPSHRSQVESPAIPAQLRMKLPAYSSNVFSTDACDSDTALSLPSPNTTNSLSSPHADKPHSETDAAVGGATTTSLNAIQDGSNVDLANEHRRPRRRCQVTFPANLNFLLLMFDILR
jgi:hypothetical protein